MKIRVLAIFAFMSFASGAVAGILPEDHFRAGDAAGGKGDKTPVLLLAETAPPSAVPGVIPSQLAPAEAANPSTAAETAPAPGESPEGADTIKDEGVPGIEAGQPPVPRRPIPPSRRRRYRPGRVYPPSRQQPSPHAPSAGASSLPQGPARGTGGGFLVKFNNADIYEVIHTLGRMAGINYLIDPRVRGVVNVHTQGMVKKEGALELLLSILRVNGATAVEVPGANQEGNLYHIVPMTEAKTEPLLLDIQGKTEGKDSPNRPVLRAFPLQYIVAAEMAKVIKPFVSAGGDVTEVPGANMILVMDTAANMEKHARLIELFDREPLGTSRMVSLYRVRHGKVQDVMNILTKLFPAKTEAVKGKQTAFRPKVAEPALKTAATVAGQEDRSAAGQEGGTKEGGFDIIPDEPTNSIIIRGSASEYAALLNVLKVIDVYPRQVLLEVLIAEVQLDDELRLGIDWRYMSQSGDKSHDVSLVTSASGISTGLLYAYEKTNRLMASVRALADDGKVSILSSPSVISTNGKESKIEVAQQIPVTSGQVTNVAGAADVITETVEYRDVGILLSFTPYINDEGLITLEISQEQSEVSSATGGALNNPTFLKRSIRTTLLATQDRSIVLGGLVQERRQRSRDGIPFLYKIPIFGWIFGARSASVSRTELLIFITPRVIESVEEGTQLSGEFEDRVEELKRRISESEGLRPSLKEPEQPDRP